MSHFLPTRASPPPKANSVYSSELAHAYPPELDNLTQEEIRLIDAVIDRAGPDATTFLTVFKAYNDVLTAEGLDPREVVFYGKLLKLGTLRGRNWGEKWRMVKDHNSSGINPRPVQSASKHYTGGGLSKQPLQTPQASGSDSEETNTEADRDVVSTHPRYTRTHALSHHLRPPSPSENSTDIGSFALLSAPNRFRNYHDSQSENTEERVPSTTPPSYSAAVRHPVTAIPEKSNSVRRLLALAATISESNQPPRAVTSPPRTKVRQGRQPQKSNAINDDDAWKKIQWQRDEEDADKFYEESLLLRCWNVWRQGYEWIRSTHEQVEEARQNLELRVAFRRWLVLYYSRQENTLQMSRQADARYLRLFLTVWRSKWKERKQAAWRRQMRNNMKIVRGRHDLNLQRALFVRWSNAYQMSCLEKELKARWLSKYLDRWKTRCSEIQSLDHIASQVAVANENKSVRQHFNLWRRMLLLKDIERHMTEVVRVRRLAFFMTVWQRRLERFTAASRYYEVSLQRRVLRKWEGAHNHVQAMEVRVQRYLVRQDAVLMRAVMRVWIAHERGKRFEHLRSAKLQRSAWRIWNQRFESHRQDERNAVAFSQRPASSTALVAFHTWWNATRSHQSVLSEATHYHQSRLLSSQFTRWQARLKHNREMVQIADSLALRQVLQAWRLRLSEKQRQRKLIAYQKSKEQKIFRVWYLRTQDSRRLRLCEQDIRMRMNQRIVNTALHKWESRVTEIKAREDLVARHRERNTQRRAFAHWTTICLKHVKRLDLLESQLIVKQKEFVNTTFCRWFAAARAAAEMKRLLAEQQEEARLATLKAAWDKWRERFIAERLAPKEIEVRELMQRNLAFRMFGVWHSRTRSLPAVHLYAKNTKARYFQVWLEAVPQAQKARKHYSKVMFSKYLQVWLQKYRQKMAARAVNRARYLRLSTNAPRNSAGVRYPVSRPLPSQEDDSTTTAEEESETEDGGTAVQPSISAFLAPKNRERTADKPKEEPKSRRADEETEPFRRKAPSQIASSDKGEVASRGRFWQELQQIRSKSRPPSETASTSTRR